MSPNATQTNHFEYSAEVEALLAEPNSPPRIRKLLLNVIFIFLLAVLISYVPDIRRLETSYRDLILCGLGMHLFTVIAVAYPWRWTTKDAPVMLWFGFLSSLREFFVFILIEIHSQPRFWSLHSWHGRRCSEEFEIIYIWRGSLNNTLHSLLILISFCQIMPIVYVGTTIFIAGTIGETHWLSNDTSDFSVV